MEQPDESSQAAETAADPARTEAGDGSLGASPNRRMQTPSASSQRHGSQGVDGPPPGFEPLDEFSMADSFVLGVLRGFRLLQAAGSNAEEKGNLELEVVTPALQTLWDEQFLGRSSTSYLPSSPNYFQESFTVLEEPDYNDWWPSDGYESYWAEAGYSDQPWEDDWWGEEHDLHHQQLASVEAPVATDPDDPALQDSLQSEKEAESFALQAQRTWVEAQTPTAALRRDRGFGQSKNGAAGEGTSGCFICGGDHGWRECPDRHHPSNFKGKGFGFKGRPMSSFAAAAEWDRHDAHFLKGKGKSKSKKRNWLDANAAWKGKGKSKTGAQRPSVNAYNSEVFYGLEMKTSMDLKSTESSTIGKPGNTFLDCGATASAGPEASLQGLIHSIHCAIQAALLQIWERQMGSSS